MRPLFIVFEGLDGSGSSTQAKLLATALPSATSLVTRLTSEPSEGPIGRMIRGALAGSVAFAKDPVHFDRQLAYLFAADRYDHLHNNDSGVFARISKGEFVVCTRYYFSSYAYHCASEQDWQLVSTLNDRFPPPDLTVYLDVPVSVSLARIAERSQLDIYENEQKLSLVRNNYEKVFADYTGRFLRVDGTRAEADIHQNVFEKVIELAKKDVQ